VLVHNRLPTFVKNNFMPRQDSERHSCYHTVKHLALLFTRVFSCRNSASYLNKLDKTIRRPW